MTKEQFIKWKKNGNFKLSQKRILEVSNHISEGFNDCYTKAEAAEVVMYFSLDNSYLIADLEAIKMEGLLEYGRKLVNSVKIKKI